MEQGRHTELRYRVTKNVVARGVGAALLCLGLTGGAAADMGAPTPLGMAAWAAPTQIVMAERATPPQIVMAEQATPPQIVMAEQARPMQLAMADPVSAMELVTAEQATPVQLAATFGSLPVGDQHLAEIRGGFSIGGIEFKIGFVLETILNDVVEVRQAFSLANAGDVIPDSVLTSLPGSSGNMGTRILTEFFKDGSLLVTTVVNDQDNINLEQVNTATLDISLPRNFVRNATRGFFRGGTTETPTSVKYALGVLSPGL